MKAKTKSETIDRFGDLAKRIADFKPILAEHAEIREEMAGWHEKSPADQITVEHGTRWDVEISARANVRAITSMGKLQRFLGLRKFLSLCSFTLKNVDDFVTADKRGEFVSESQTGARRITAVISQAQQQRDKAAA